MEKIDYKAIDRQMILNYLQGKISVDVDEIKENSGAEPLRIYPLLFEMEMDGQVKVLERDSQGAPLKVSLVEQ